MSQAGPNILPQIFLTGLERIETKNLGKAQAPKAQALVALVAVAALIYIGSKES